MIVTRQILFHFLFKLLLYIMQEYCQLFIYWFWGNKCSHGKRQIFSRFTFIKSISLWDRLCSFNNLLFDWLIVLIIEFLGFISAARFSFPTIFAFGFIKLFTEVANKNVNISVWNSNIIVFLNFLKLTFHLLIITDRALWFNRHLNAIIECWDDCRWCIGSTSFIGIKTFHYNFLYNKNS